MLNRRTFAALLAGAVAFGGGARGWPDLCRPMGANDFVCD